MWDRDEHSDEENLRWCWLRAIEWGSWPAFLSQPIGPIALIYFPWAAVFAAVVVANILWALTIRHRYVNVAAAYSGALAAALVWVTCPGSAIYLWFQGRRTQALLALLWPPVAWVLAAIPPTKVGTVQRQFAARIGIALGDEP